MHYYPNCPLCNCAAAPLFYAAEHRMYRCGNCSLAFVSPIPDDGFLTRFYSTFHATLEEGGGYELTESRMAADFSAKLRMLEREKLSERFRVLDVGCGKGFFVKACIDHGLDAQGIDLSDTAIQYARSALGITATCGRLEDLAPALQDFDAVTFWATIEHVPDPIATLKTIHGVLKPGGVLLLDTGIGNDWLDRLLPGLNQWYDPPQHLYVFSLDSIKAALELAGFSVVSVDTNFERNVPRRIARVLRGAAAAAGFRLVAEATRTLRSQGSFGYTRFPLGNLMSVVARKI